MTTSNPTFSKREGLAEELPLVFDTAPEGLRYGLREVLHILGYATPTQQRGILCKALRVSPDEFNWSDYPNVEGEVVQLLATEPWYKFFDALERIAVFIHPQRLPIYEEKMNVLFSEERVGYRFKSSKILRFGTQEFDAAVENARSALQDERFNEPRRQFERASQFRNDRPPDHANAIKEAVNSVEGVLQVVYARHGVSLTTIVSESLPNDLPRGIKKLFQSLYSQGSGTTGARHASIGGNDPTGPRAELAIHVASALHAFAVAELDQQTMP